MATYTSDQLYGAGVATEEISGATTFLFGNSSTGSVYFTMEQVRNADGNYSGSSTTNAVGTFSSFSGIDSSTLVTSSYKWSVVLQPNTIATLQFAPTSTIAAGSSMLRGTGDLELTIS
jgi:hypothetical protein|tara:strand:- start:118 stop:471 length:354 start_codon:yes stop_codon:yes gene_type:complete